MVEKFGFVLAATRYIFAQMIMKLFFGADEFKDIGKFTKFLFQLFSVDFRADCDYSFSIFAGDGALKDLIRSDET